MAFAFMGFVSGVAATVVTTLAVMMWRDGR
jgi:hypothetical protein